MGDDAPFVTRRGALAGLGSVAASSLAGCSERLWSRAENTTPAQVELTIKTVPADDDVVAAKILSQLRDNLREAGIDTTHEPIPEMNLYRDVLLEQDYDLFVVRHPGFDEMDALRGLLHSDFVNERGWQNPLQFSDVTIDGHLEQQRTANEDDREAMLTDLFEYFDETTPYTVIGFPDRIGGVREEISAPAPPTRPVEYYEILSREPDDGSRDDPLVVGVFGEGLGDRLNPIVADRTRIDGLLGLLYDPLARPVGEDGELVPWLAEEVDWDDSDGLEATITLREGLRWHDDERLDADDVAFTMEFLEDTSMGSVEGGVPAHRYRCRQTVLQTVEQTDTRTVTFSFGDSNRAVAERSLTIPILPKHVWESRSEVIAEYRTDALATDNQEPVGSGLLELTEVTSDEIVLDPFEEHVFRDSSADRPDVLSDFSQYSGLRFRTYPNPGSMVESLLDGDIDLTTGMISSTEREALSDASDSMLRTASSTSFYMIGYNLHHEDLGNPRFRRVISRLVDREYVVSEFLDGQGKPATRYSSLVGLRDDEWGFDQPSDLTTFPGSDGEVNPTRVRSLFEDAGYRYEDDELLR
ncbi:ABC transporter substrate-binding protein [Natrarchaeobaculum sulfurireducens]|uniref:ABC transporter substrate-binding protein n=1 Tax=Natrarchaeobaculum sulfurireducens TaxID=2044521 RepID=UPI000E3E4294|nr:ABC transporter substrate-binding protein [Natrarchaeobaculum sulfurireducens]